MTAPFFVGLDLGFPWIVCSLWGEVSEPWDFVAGR